MLDLKYIRSNVEAVKANCENRNVKVDVDRLLQLDEQTRSCKGELDQIRQQRNDISKRMKGKLPPEERQPLIAQSKEFKEKEAELDSRYQQLLIDRSALHTLVPNMTHPDSPIGADEDANKPLRHVGEPPQLDFEPKDHVELMEALDLVDFEGGAKVAGQKFYYLKNEAVLLELALMQYAINLLRQEGFTPYMTPDMARNEILYGIGFNPRGDETQVYSIENTDLSLVATAEITLGGLLANTVLEADELPKLYAGISHCFRTEAGAAGKESKGLYRVHQFTKVEMFAFVTPEESNGMHDRFLALEEKIYQDLELPYRVVDISTGDLGSPAYRKYDIEAWMPGRGKYGEVTSTSNCTDYQSRRLNIRYKNPASGQNEFVHMLNGTAIAISRTLIALIENGQQADGSIRLPKCLGLADILPR